MGNKVVICGVDTSVLPKLTSRESQELLERIANKDENAREQFIVANMRLVLSIIKKFWAKKVSSDDVFQAGMIGLIKAVDNFDLKFNVKFSTYAVPMIMGEIKRHLRENNSMRVARSIRDTAYQVLKTRTEIEKEDEDPSFENIAKKMNIAVSEVVYCLDAISDTVSLYEPVYSKNGEELLLVDKICDNKNNDESWTDSVALDNALFGLKAREQDVIRLRYFDGKTQTEISSFLGISQAQVSRIEKTALKEIKQRIMV